MNSTEYENKLKHLRYEQDMLKFFTTIPGLVIRLKVEEQTKAKLDSAQWLRRRLSVICCLCQEIDGVKVIRPYELACPRCDHEITCEQGCDSDKCEWFGDGYNIDGDCLAEK